jgi:eukaryotic-like serine/threonine-protein kinase
VTDSKRIVYASARDGEQNLYWQAADGTGTAERLTTSANDQFPYVVTPDGQSVIYIELSSTTSYDIYSVPLTGDRKPKALLATQFDERRPALSPDGKWMVYQSNESSQFELFVRPFPNVEGGRWQVSAGGGSSPIWSPDGREIYYRQGQTIQHVAVKTSPVFSAGTPSQLFQTTLPVDSAGMSYGIAPDGKQFLVVKPASGTTGPVEYRVVLNWIEDVRARARPAK